MKPQGKYTALLAAVLAVLLLTGCKTEYPELEQDSAEDVAEYRRYYQQEVLPYFNSQGEFGFFEGVESVDISYAKFEVENGNGALVILHGLNETYIKYAELIYDLRDLGLSVYIMEHRGHGNSDRILNDNEQEQRKIYIKSFDNYVTDAKIFLDTVVNATPHEKHFIFAHSVGGNVAAQLLEQYPNAFDAAVLSSPMMEVLTTHPTKVNESLGYAISKVFVGLGLGKSYSLDMQEPEVIIDASDPEKFEAELLSKSWKRWSVYNEVIELNPHLIAGGPGATWGISNNFAKQAYEATYKARSANEASKIITPILMFQSGDDWIVGTKGMNTFKNNAVNAASFDTIVFPDAYHESYMERDDIRDTVISETKLFLGAF
ncbi:hypothetical protein A9Q99_06625 [Gammaproteobacteria bacterium 45_16_T64]|nr:hypothetical protein A9Q99_06625 [Gammaproteobacteria bacterium 45_16_T64]